MRNSNSPFPTHRPSNLLARRFSLDDCAMGPVPAWFPVSTIPNAQSSRRRSQTTADVNFLATESPYADGPGLDYDSDPQSPEIGGILTSRSL